MKKYILFAWHDYSSQGGLDDIYDSYDEIGQAIAQAQYLYHRQNVQIVDRDTWEEISFTTITESKPLDPLNFNIIERADCSPDTIYFISKQWLADNARIDYEGQNLVLPIKETNELIKTIKK